VRFTRHAILAVAVLALAGIVSVGNATPPQPGPLDVSGEINGAPFRIIVPAVWNGTLVEFARGYTDRADHPGEIDNRNPTIAPNNAVRDSLLARGYALAGSARKNNGWSVEDGLDDVVALVSYFRENVANPSSAILWGASGGTVIALETAERNGGAFDGFLTTASVGAGASRTWDQTLVLRLAYDVTFGMPGSWGTVGDIRDDLDFETDVAPIVTAQAADPANFGRFEFIRMVAGVPGQGITPPPGFYPGQLVAPGRYFYFATEGEAELERRAGGPIGQNISHVYALTEAEKVYLASLGVDAEPLLEAMNARRNIAAPPSPRSYLEHFADYSGLIKHPVLTVHTALDDIVPVAHESAYRNTVAAVDRDDLLVQVYTTEIGHNRFTTTQQLTAVHALDEWVRTGTRPDPSAFPAALGFIPGFVPPPWFQQELTGSVTAAKAIHGAYESGVAALSSGAALAAASEAGSDTRFGVRVRGNGDRGVQLVVATGKEGRLRVRLYDMQGRVVASIADEPLISAGIRSFDIRTGRREAGSLPSGIYFYRVDATEGVRNGKIVFVR
jgi:hypothetical protein